MTKIIEVKNLSKTYQNLKAVNNLAFEVEKAKCYTLLGPNGAGKTTTLKLLFGKARRDKNADTMVSVSGFDPKHQYLEIKYLSGIVPQEDNLDFELNVESNLIVYSKFYGLPKNIAQKRIAELLDFMELKDKKKAMIRELSGGMKRRLLIARALLHDPKILILDEPTTGLDPQVRHLIWHKIRELKEKGVTVLLTTHYMEEAFNLADTILIMNEGSKVLEGNPRQLVKQELEEYVLEIYEKCAKIISKKAFDEKIIRKESHAASCYLYSNDLKELQNITQNLETGEYYLRSSNLEDLFLKITGRHLNAKQ
ncbi:ABC transporter ATP-binding protein [Candidatus Margulisiibacteriota bacterium]